jgi:hypothetical protein
MPPSNYPFQQSLTMALPSVSSPTTNPNDDDDVGELPDQGLVAPWEVLRRLADITSERAAKVRQFLIYFFGIFIMITRH